MNNAESKTKFWLGNAVLAVAMLMLFYMEDLWSLLGSAAMVVWIVLVGVGVYFLMNDRSEPPTFSG
ncbi:MAG: hypothetical protein KKH12_01575 [Gammaproteobacteria bacterium]|nr:hypothetical protein [Gammaproteobacteria bacterium]MBU1480343.1 hypothetical protein [Gammaproteobacteria bacterium]